jgi:gluconate 2-dehydrogenase gamma chain
VKRRELLLAAAALPVLKIERAANYVASLGPQQPALKFFTAAEWATVRVLVDDIIPRDARSGSATDAKVPEFMDFFLADPEIPGTLPADVRRGLAWLEAESRRRFGVGYAAAAESARHGLLGEIAWPARARVEMREAAAFFTQFRNLTASGFWSSPVGYQDLDYRGGVFNVWDGCPPEALKKLGVSY